MPDLEPGLRISREQPVEPLVSEVAMRFAPLTFQSSALVTPDFQKRVNELLGSGAIVAPEYSESDIRRLADTLAAKGKPLDAKGLAGLSPKGVRVYPAGQIKRNGKVITVNRMSIGDMGFSCNVAGTSDDAVAVLEAVASIIGQISGENHGWAHYQSKLSITKYGTATVSQFKAPLRKLLGARGEGVLALVEGSLAKGMVPIRAGVRPEAPAFAKVMVHEIRTWVTVVEADGTTNSCRLEFSHASDEAAANREVHVVSELDYESHQNLLAALEKALSSEHEKDVT